jgi:hypothetical protein
MIFPDDTWNSIMSYFHSAYKKPLHYEAIMEVPEFYFCVLHRRQSHTYGLRWNRPLQVDSYYMRLIIQSNFNASRVKGTSQIKRGVASPKICDDFINIFEIYKQNCLTNVLNNINYI